MTGATLKPAADFAAALEALERARDGRDPAWLADLRARALERFRALGLPTTRHEEWRYTSLREVARTPYEPAPAGGPAPARAELEPRLLPAGEATRVVLVDGRLAPGLSDPLDGTAGVRVRALRDALADGGERLEALLGRVAAFDERPIAALSTALFPDGLLVEVEPGAEADRPLQVVLVGTGGERPRASFPRLVVSVGRAGRLRLVETHVGPGAGALAAPVTEVALDDGAALDHVVLQEEGEGASWLASCDVRVGRDARYGAHLALLGASLGRHELRVLFAGEGGDARFAALYAAGGERHAAVRTVVDHAVPHCTSEQELRGVLDGRARGVFHGTVLVREGASGTQADQSNKNLLLSREADADTRPELEILTDDVRCSHGATVGQLDPDEIFYLRSRGFGEAEARAVLTLGFADAALDGLEPGALRERVHALVRDRLAPAAARIEEEARP